MPATKRAKPSEDAFPQSIRKGNVTVRIYRMKHRDGFTYAVTYRKSVVRVDPATGQERQTTERVKQSFKDLEIARREANNIAHKLTVGDLEALKLTGHERQIYVAANHAIAHTKLTLDVVAREFARAYDLLGRDAVVEAVRFFKARTESTVEPMLVPEAIARFVAAKEAEGISPHYRKDLRLILEKGVGEHFRCNLATVTADDLRAYLNARPGGPVARNNHRRLVVALFNFAKGAGWLPANESTAAAGLGTYNVKGKDVTIYTPEELAALLGHAGEEFLPWLALIAFGGLRHQELRKGLAWENIDFAKGTLIVPAAIAKTGQKRKVVMAENLRAWVAPYSGRKGAIFSKDPRVEIESTAAAAGVPWKRNALRHGFGSYRMESVKNAGQVSLEMGNSASVVMKHYFEIVDADAAKAYWEIKPNVG